MNPLNGPVHDIFRRLNALNGMLLTLEDQLGGFEKLCRQSLSEASFDTSRVFSGTSLVIRDLTEWPENRCAVYYPCGVFSSKGEEYFDLIKILLARESSWTVSQAYEAFETFLKDILAIFLRENKDLAEATKVERFESDKRGRLFVKTDIAFWKEYTDYHYHTNANKLKLLRKICPNISRGEKENNRDIDLTEWFPVVEEIRHGVTHSNSMIRSSRIKNWSMTKRQILKRCFPGIEIADGYQLNIKSTDVTFCLSLFSEYSFQVYKFLSILRGYDWNIIQKGKRT